MHTGYDGAPRKATWPTWFLPSAIGYCAVLVGYHVGWKSFCVKDWHNWTEQFGSENNSGVYTVPFVARTRWLGRNCSVCEEIVCTKTFLNISLLNYLSASFLFFLYVYLFISFFSLSLCSYLYLSLHFAFPCFFPSSISLPLSFLLPFSFFFLPSSTKRSRIRNPHGCVFFLCTALIPHPRSAAEWLTGWMKYILLHG